MLFKLASTAVYGVCWVWNLTWHSLRWWDGYASPSEKTLYPREYLIPAIRNNYRNSVPGSLKQCFNQNAGFSWVADLCGHHFSVGSQSGGLTVNLFKQTLFYPVFSLSSIILTFNLESFLKSVF